jgi:hypothetical protein
MQAISLYEIIRQPGLLLAIIRGADMTTLCRLNRVCRASAQIIQQYATEVTLNTHSAGQEMLLTRWRRLHGVKITAYKYPAIHQWITDIFAADPIAASSFTSITLAVSHIDKPTVWRYWGSNGRVTGDVLNVPLRGNPLWTPRSDGPPQFTSETIHTYMRANEYIIWGFCPCGSVCRTSIALSLE